MRNPFRQLSYGKRKPTGRENMELVREQSQRTFMRSRRNPDGRQERASFQELRQFLTRREAEAVIAGLSMSSVVDTEEALSGPLDTAGAVYRANLEMRCFRQEVVRVVLLDREWQLTGMPTLSHCRLKREMHAHSRLILDPIYVHKR